MRDQAALIAERLAELWSRSLPIILERTAVLREACDALSRDPADVEARSAGREAAHKLSGSLGIFGLPRGTELASAMEEVLQGTGPLAPARVQWLVQQTRELDSVIASRLN